MTKEELKQYIDQNVYENQDGDITGESLNAVLKAIVDDGGTEVEANPTGEATETLGKLKIGETIYTAPQGPQGEPGEDGQDGQPGPANTLTIGTVTDGEHASASITGEAPNQQLNLVLPKGEQGDPGQNAVNPFKGWFTTANIPTTGQEGDYCNVSDTSVTPHTVTIYRWSTAQNAFVDTGEVPDTATGETFASSETLQQVAIDNSHLANPVNTADPMKPVLADARDVAVFKDSTDYKLSGINGEIITPSVTPVLNAVAGIDFEKGGVAYSKGRLVPFDSATKHIEVDVSDYDSVIFNGIEVKYGTDFSKTGYAFGYYEEGHDGDDAYWHTIEAYRWDEITSGHVEKEYRKDVPEATGAIYFRTSCAYGSGNTWFPNFYIKLQRGDTLIDVINRQVENVSFSTNEKLNQIGIDSTNLANPSNNDLAKAKDVAAFNNSFSYKLQGVDGEVLELETTQTLNQYFVVGHDVEYDEDSYYGGDFVYNGNNYGASEFALGNSDRVVFLSIDLNSNPTSVPLKDIGYALGHYDNNEWVCDVAELWIRTSRATGYELREYIVDIPEGATHLRTMTKVFSKLTSSNFYVYGLKGKNVVQMIEELKQQIAQGKRIDIVGKRYVNMSSSTFSYPWHGALVESLGMEYLHVGMGGASHRCSKYTRFGLDYQNGNLHYFIVDTDYGLTTPPSDGDTYTTSNGTTVTVKKVYQLDNNQYFIKTEKAGSIPSGGGTLTRLTGSGDSSIIYSLQSAAYERVILNQIANLLTTHFNEGYYPHFIVSCCVINDCGSSISAASIGTAASAMDADFTESHVAALFLCDDASEVATAFENFFYVNNGSYSSATCFRLAIELLSHYFPAAQIIVSSCQIINNDSYSDALIGLFNEAQEELCAKYSIPYVRLNNEVGINKINITTWLKSDKLHPNTDGEMLYTNYFKEQLNHVLVVRNNIE